MTLPRLLAGIELILSVMHPKCYSRIFWMCLLKLSQLSKCFLHNSCSPSHMDINFKLELLFLSHPTLTKCILHYNYYLRYIRLKIAQKDLYYLIVFHSELKKTLKGLLHQKPSKRHNFLDPQHLLQSLNLSNLLKLELLAYQTQVFLTILFAIMGQFAKTTSSGIILKSNQQSY